MYGAGNIPVRPYILTNVFSLVGRYCLLKAHLLDSVMRTLSFEWLGVRSGSNRRLRIPPRFYHLNYARRIFKIKIY